ncbi:aspartate--tRNA ligase, partial [Francisella tularensis subsp. holarctica]|uniref:OB-fold nucleic acid binding domain-containing protein n=1 Tax=Francisella tularensis TaxID=263 RepID=UPI0023ADC2E9|nr:aspartate--tRNA ligase [Francisella tularensis subsp. holarctica]
QLVFNPDNDNFKDADRLRSEFVIKAEGVVNLRPDGQENKNISSGKVEIICDSIEVINKSKSIPFQLDDFLSTGEYVNLKYRYIDLR